MGIVNLSSNSFYSNSIIQSTQDLVNRVQLFKDQGADIIDLGACSTRPGSKIIDQKLEQQQLTEAFHLIKPILGSTLLSIDTMHSATAEALLNLGADMINDVSAGNYDSEMANIIAHFKVPYIIMHMRGIPETMQRPEFLKYDNLVPDILKYFSELQNRYIQKNIHQLIIDPGFGFSKNLEQNFELLHKLELFEIMELPLLVGLSRKSMIAKTLHTTADDALFGTISAQTIALMKGASILRVHDVKAAKDAIDIYKKMMSSNHV